MWFWSVFWSSNCPVYFSLFLVDQKKFVQSQEIFGQALNFLVDQISFWYTKIFFCYTKIFFAQPNFFGRPKKWEIGFWSTKKKIGRPKNVKLTGQLVDQETDQKHMDAATEWLKIHESIIWFKKLIMWHWQ